MPGESSANSINLFIDLFAHSYIQERQYRLLISARGLNPSSVTY